MRPIHVAGKSQLRVFTLNKRRSASSSIDAITGLPTSWRRPAR